MQSVKKFYFLLSLIILISACTYDNIEEYFGESCPPETVSYKDDIDDILETRCGACHRNGSELGGVNLEKYEDVKEYVNDGKLLKVIRHEPGVDPMPQGSPKIPAEEITKIENWINECAKDN